MIEILRIIAGSLFALFIPGFLTAKLFFPEFKILEKIAFSIAFSIMISIVIAIYFGYDEAWALKTGGLTFPNIVKAECFLLFIFAIIFLVKYIIKKTKEHIKNETT
ncbi:MAG: hypothetical protein V1859_03615 [archaeon]